jgi:hypothetical protein
MPTFKYNIFHEDEGIDADMFSDLQEIHIEHTTEITRDNIVLDTDITGGTPEAVVFQLAEDKFAVKMPIPYGLVVGKSNLHFYKNGVEITDIAEHERPYLAERGQDPLSTDWVFAFRVDEPYDDTATYTLTWVEKIIPINSEYIYGIPFDKDMSSPEFNSQECDNIMFPILPSPFVYEIWTFKRHTCNSNGVSAKRQYALGIKKHLREGDHRYKLYYRADSGEYTLQEFVSRNEGPVPINTLRLGINSAAYKIRPFKIRIYNTDTGARSPLSLVWGWQQTGDSYATRGFRRLKTK